MISPRLRNALILLGATAGLSGCVGMYPGMSVGYGNGGYYDPYGYGGYGGYGSSYYGSGYGSPYYGWYDDYYYPGTGYWVYDRYGSRRQWTDAQRRYWNSRDRGDTKVVDNWSGYRTGTSGAMQGWVDRQDHGTTNAVTTTSRTSTTDARNWRQRDRSTSSSDRVTTRSSRSDRSDRASARASRDAARGIQRVKREKD